MRKKAFNMKTGIALAGGGSKGSYQTGVWKALRELGIDYDIVTGTSIGAINGALMVMGDYERAERLWSTITVEDIMANGVNLKHDIEYYFENRDQLLLFAKEFAASRGADIEPYKARVHQELGEEAFFSSPVDYACVTARFPSLQMVEARKADMTPGAVEPWLIASSSCFPVFPLCEIDGQNYIDGGYADNLPISTAFRLGAERVIAVALKPEAFEKTYPRHPLVKRIVPSRPLGPFLDFSRDVLERNLRLGYVDTMRAFGCYLGNQYSFEKSGEAVLLNAARKYLLWLLRLELTEPESGVQAMLERFSGNTKLNDTLFSHDRGDLLSASLTALEYIMSLLGYAHEDIYDLHVLLPALRQELLCENAAPAVQHASELAAKLTRTNWVAQLRQLAPGAGGSDGEILLATWLLYLREQGTEEEHAEQ